MEKKLRQISLFFGDVIFAFLALFITVILGFWNNFNGQIFFQHLLPFSILYFFWFIFFYIFGLYDLNLIKPNPEFLTRTGQCFLMCLLVGITFFYLVPLFGITPKTNLLLNIIILAVFVLLWRRFFYHLFSFYYRQNVIFLDKNPLTKLLIEKIKSNPQLGYKFVGFLDATKHFFPQLKNKKIDKIILTQNSHFDKKISQELYKCLTLKIDFIDVFRAYETIFYEIPIDFLNQMWFLENLKTNEKKNYDKIKRVLDVILTFFLSIIFLPIGLIVAIFIKLSHRNGPIIYKQKRVGNNNKIFTLYKFGTMRTDKGELWTMQNDKRLTFVGKILRDSHLDEIPQLYNILKGDISFVGPRAERKELVNIYSQIPYYELRHIIKPGLTGWAQINYKPSASIEEARKKFCYDLYYIKNRSFFLDLGIFFKTLQYFFKGK
jgi:exopolysaccharide biosynthesis polyprenyl glycosylphosphotransferase